MEKFRFIHRSDGLTPVDAEISGYQSGFCIILNEYSFVMIFIIYSLTDVERFATESYLNK